MTTMTKRRRRVSARDSPGRRSSHQPARHIDPLLRPEGYEPPHQAGPARPPDRPGVSARTRTVASGPRGGAVTVVRIAVAGGTGWTGRLVVGALRAGGDEPVVLARSAGADLTTGAGLAGKLDGLAAVIDVTNIATTRAKAAVRFFEAVTANLLAAEQEAGVPHHVALSIVGVDRVDLGYYAAKRRQETLVLREPGQPGAPGGTVLRATQFHE